MLLLPETMFVSFSLEITNHKMSFQSVLFLAHSFHANSLYQTFILPILYTFIVAQFFCYSLYLIVLLKTALLALLSLTLTGRRMSAEAKARLAEMRQRKKEAKQAEVLIYLNMK